MPVDNLLRPDNRLLGFGANDFSFYGGQPGTGVVTARIGPAPATPERPAADVANGPAPDRAPSNVAAAQASIDPAAPVQSGADETSAAPQAPTDFSSTAAQPLGDGPQGAPIGGGSTAPLIIASPAQAAPDGSTVGSDNVAPAALASATGTGVADVGQLVGDATSPLLEALAGIGPGAATLGSVDAALTNVTDAVGGAINGVQAGLTDTLAATSGSLASLTDTIDVAVPSYDLDNLVFTGSDPAGGIATLVDLVQSSELFAVGQPDLPAVPDAAGSIGDDLVAETTAVAPLLGDNDGQNDLIDDPLSHLGL